MCLPVAVVLASCAAAGYDIDEKVGGDVTAAWECGCSA